MRERILFFPSSSDALRKFGLQMLRISFFLLLILLAIESRSSVKSPHETESITRKETNSAAAIINSSTATVQVQEGTMLSFDLSAVLNLTMTSIIYNPTSHMSEWVDKIFGSKGIFYEKNAQNIMDEKDLTADEINYRSRHFKSRFSLPNYAIRPSCSIELLGFVKVDELGDFTSKIRRELFIGDATLKIQRRSILWKCFYRVLFENWRRDTKNAEPNFWSVLFYCPAPNIEACRILEGKLKDDDITDNESPKMTSEEGIIVLQVPFKENVLWTASFSSRRFIGKDRPKDDYIGNLSGSDVLRIQNESSQYNYSGKKLKNITSYAAAVCLSIPYTSTDTDKEIANGAMLLEWIRYYTLLGFKVLIYDRDGANSHHIFGSKYGESQKIRFPSGRLVYHPYTIRGILDLSSKGLRYDNTEIELNNNHGADNLRLGRFESQGHDKVQTLTHCRFEAKALYGIENVLIVDFDEFLYCPIVPSTIKAQSDWIHRYFQRMKNEGINQIEFTQRVVGNKTTSPRDCIIKKTIDGQSIFDCFGTYLVYNGAHSIKSMHLGHSCPLTGYHTACPTNEIPRSHDCLCKSYLMKSNNWKPYEHRKGRECAVVHLSTNIKSYGRKFYVFTAEEQELVSSSKSELWTIMNPKKKKNKGKESKKIKIKTKQSKVKYSKTKQNIQRIE